MRNLDEEYFDWLCDFTKSKRGRSRTIKTYNALLNMLYDAEFVPMIPHDENRGEDGIGLRWRFSKERGVKYDPDRGCSVLEMMIALALRCEEQIMDDPDIGNRTSQWFWMMVRNLGLFEYSDDKFTSKSRNIINDILDVFINREYEYNGSGGLFVIENSRKDLRKVEIWYQMCWYLDNLM